jgi:DNA modification methylase
MGTLHRIDCLIALRVMPDDSVDSIVIDPPYDLTSGNSSSGGNSRTIPKGFSVDGLFMV